MENILFLGKLFKEWKLLMKLPKFLQILKIGPCKELLLKKLLWCKMLLIKTKLKKSSIHGFGLFADENIKKGRIIWKFNPTIDKKITKKEMNLLPDLAKKYLIKYAFLDHEGNWILCGD